MERIKLLVCLLFFGVVNICAQNRNQCKYTYDNAGNRIKREILLSRSVPSSDNNEVKPFTDKMNDKNIRIFPNPTKGNLTIDILGEGEIEGNLLLFNLSGKLLIKKEINSVTTQLNISMEPNGIYFMEIELGTEKTSWKIIKE